MFDVLKKTLAKRSVFVIGAVLIVAVGVLATYGFTRDDIVDWTGRDTVTVTLTDEGFVPRKMYVSRGTRITFTNETEKPFWPASDLHPFHEIYPEFDPKAPLSATSTWDFVIEKDGHWDYHDHIGLHTGSIVVIPPGLKGSKTYDVPPACDQDDFAGRQSCWKQHLVFDLREGGLEQAFETLATLYVEHPELHSECHFYAHDLGLLVWEKYGARIPLLESMSSCGHGFFHGYMEGYLQGSEGNIERAIRFCDKVRKRFAEAMPLMGPQCLHGIGHGYMEYLLTTRTDLFSSPRELIGMGIDGCGRISSDEKFRCASGIYSVFKDWVNVQGKARDYSQLFSEEDPFGLCRPLTVSWKKDACAWTMGKQAWNLTGYDIRRALLNLERGGEYWEGGFYTGQALMSSAFGYGEHNVQKPDRDLLSVCTVLLEKNRPYCVKGILSGLVFNAQPGNEIERPLAFCSQEGMPASLGEVCVNSLTKQIADIHGSSGRDSVCRRIADTFPSIDACR